MPAFLGFPMAGQVTAIILQESQDMGQLSESLNLPGVSWSRNRRHAVPLKHTFKSSATMWLKFSIGQAGYQSQLMGELVSLSRVLSCMPWTLEFGASKNGDFYRVQTQLYPIPHMASRTLDIVWANQAIAPLSLFRNELFLMVSLSPSGKADDHLLSSKSSRLFQDALALSGQDLKKLFNKASWFKFNSHRRQQLFIDSNL